MKARDWDAVVDFMVWGSEFSEVMPLLLDNTRQYVFLSSSRVYAQSDLPITEEAPRLLDVCGDEEYLSTNEYALAKAREEDLLRKSGKMNYTIIRPYITYNTQRLQLGVLEKENWLYRALRGRSIVFSQDIASKLTTLTWGDDVAKGISSIIGNKNAFGEAFHVTYSKPILWSDVLNIYIYVLEDYLGKKIKVVFTKNSLNLRLPHRKWQVLYCRLFNHTYDNTKISCYCDLSRFISPQEGLTRSLKEFLKKPSFSTVDWMIEALSDKAANERTPLGEIKGLTNKIYYLSYRYNLPFLRGLWVVLRKII